MLSTQEHGHQQRLAHNIFMLPQMTELNCISMVCLLSTIGLIRAVEDQLLMLKLPLVLEKHLKCGTTKTEAVLM